MAAGGLTGLTTVLASPANIFRAAMKRNVLAVPQLAKGSVEEFTSLSRFYGRSAGKMMPRYALKFGVNDFLKIQDDGEPSVWRSLRLGAITGYTQEQQKGNPSKLKGAVHWVYRTVNKSGPRGLYRGVSYDLAELIPRTAFELTFYDELSRGHEDAFWWRVSGGWIAGSMAQILVYPIHRVQDFASDVDHGMAPRERVKIVWGQTKAAFKAEGYRGFFRGLVLALWIAAPQYAIQFIMHDELLVALMNEGKEPPAATISYK